MFTPLWDHNSQFVLLNQLLENKSPPARYLSFPAAFWRSAVYTFCGSKGSLFGFGECLCVCVCVCVCVKAASVHSSFLFIKLFCQSKAILLSLVLVGFFLGHPGTSLVVQCLRLRSSSAGGPDSILRWETKILHAAWLGQKKKDNFITVEIGSL